MDFFKALKQAARKTPWKDSLSWPSH